MADTGVYCKFDSKEKLDKFIQIYSKYTPDDKDEEELNNFFNELNVDISDVAYDYDQEWSISGLERTSDTETYFNFIENNMFASDEMIPALMECGCLTVITSSYGDWGDCIVAGKNNDEGEEIYATGDNEEIDAMFSNDGTFEGGNIRKYVQLINEGKIKF